MSSNSEFSGFFDFHTHIFPEIPFGIGEKIHPARRALRKLSPLNPWMANTYLDNFELLPESWQTRLETIDIVPIAYQALIEGTYRDYQEIAGEYKISKSLVVAQPPVAKNDFVLSLCNEDQSLLPCLQFDLNEADNHSVNLDEFHKLGVRCLKFHGASSGILPDDDRILELLEQANDLSWIVLVHTGVLQIAAIFKRPEAGSITLYKDWLIRFPNIDFVFAHANIKHYQDVESLLDLSESFYVTTSWQTESSIIWLKQRMGADRLLFASDWPTVGSNQHYATERLTNLLDEGFLTEDDFEKISFRNAESLMLKSSRELPNRHC